MEATSQRLPSLHQMKGYRQKTATKNDIDLEQAEREIIAHLRHEKERRAGNCSANFWQWGKNKRDNEKAKANYSNAE